MTSVAAVVEELHQAARLRLGQPYAIFGHSMGSLLAYEWTRRIAADGLPRPICLFVSGRKAAHLPSSHKGLHQLPPEAFLQELKSRYGGEPEALLGDPELRELFMPILRTDLQLVETYAWVQSEALSCEILAFAGEDDGSVSNEGLARWRELTTGRFASRRFAGDHFYSFHQGQADLLHVMATTLQMLASEVLSVSQAAG